MKKPALLVLLATLVTIAGWLSLSLAKDSDQIVVFSLVLLNVLIGYLIAKYEMQNSLKS